MSLSVGVVSVSLLVAAGQQGPVYSQSVQSQPRIISSSSATPAQSGGVFSGFRNRVGSMFTPNRPASRQTIQTVPGNVRTVPYQTVEPQIITNEHGQVISSTAPGIQQGQVIQPGQVITSTVDGTQGVQTFTVGDGPNDGSSAPEILPDGTIKNTVDPKLKPNVKKQFENQIGFAEDYSWITGQLFYIHANGGMWVLRYNSVDSEDKYGGSVVIKTTVSMKNFREGDLVNVKGELVDEGRASKQLGGPAYRVFSIDMIERAQ